MKNISIKDIENTLKQINIPEVKCINKGLYKFGNSIITNEKGLKKIHNKIKVLW